MRRQIRSAATTGGNLLGQPTLHTPHLDSLRSATRHYAEHSGYWESTNFLKEVDRNAVTTYYDSVSGKPLFKAPLGRSFDDFERESRSHGWPSFRGGCVCLVSVALVLIALTLSCFCRCRSGGQPPAGSPSPRLAAPPRHRFHGSVMHSPSAAAYRACAGAGCMGEYASARKWRVGVC
jgi:hypothetical protein